MRPRHRLEVLALVVGGEADDQARAYHRRRARKAADQCRAGRAASSSSPTCWSSTEPMRSGSPPTAVRPPGSGNRPCPWRSSRSTARPHASRASAARSRQRSSRSSETGDLAALAKLRDKLPLGPRRRHARSRDSGPRPRASSGASSASRTLDDLKAAAEQETPARPAGARSRRARRRCSRRSPSRPRESADTGRTLLGKVLPAVRRAVEEIEDERPRRAGLARPAACAAAPETLTRPRPDRDRGRTRPR